MHSGSSDTILVGWGLCVCVWGGGGDKWIKVKEETFNDDNDRDFERNVDRSPTGSNTRPLASLI